MNQIVSNRIRELRLQHGLTQAEVAKLLDISPSLVAKQEVGTRPIGSRDIEKYARLFKVPAHQIFVKPQFDGDTEDYAWGEHDDDVIDETEPIRGRLIPEDFLT